MRAFPGSLSVGVLALTSVAGAGCGLGDALSLETVDPHTLPTNPTWADDIRPRMDYRCVSCHSDLQAGPVGQNKYDFRRFEDVVVAFFLIERYALKERSMPPGGMPKMTTRDAGILERWKARGYPQCATAADCGDELCVPCPTVSCLGSLVCRATCTTDADCSLRKICVPCPLASDCEGSQVCVARCQRSSDCRAAQPICGPKGSCVACSTSAQCRKRDAATPECEAGLCRP